MEDRMLVLEEVLPKTRLLAAVDGHGGHKAAELVVKQLGDTIQKLGPWPFEDLELLQHKFAELFADLDQQLLEHLRGDADEVQSSSGLSSGCVACIVLQRGESLYIASVGDCKVLSFDEKGGARLLSGPEHHPDMAEEAARLKACGAKLNIDGSLAGLAVSRALGDFNFQDNWSKPPGLVTTPAVYKHELEALGTNTLLVATDGLDEMSKQRMASLLRSELQGEKLPMAAAQALADEAGQHGDSGDNVGVAVLMVKRPPAPIVEEKEPRQAPRLFGRGRCSLDELMKNAPAENPAEKPSPSTEEESQ